MYERLAFYFNQDPMIAAGFLSAFLGLFLLASLFWWAMYKVGLFSIWLFKVWPNLKMWAGVMHPSAGAWNKYLLPRRLTLKSTTYMYKHIQWRWFNLSLSLNWYDAN